MPTVHQEGRLISVTLRNLLKLSGQAAQLAYRAYARPTRPAGYWFYRDPGFPAAGRSFVARLPGQEVYVAPLLAQAGAGTARAICGLAELSMLATSTRSSDLPDHGHGDPKIARGRHALQSPIARAVTSGPRE